MNPGVILCTGSGPYQAGLVQALLANGMLVRAIRVAPSIVVLEPRGASLTSLKEYPHTTLRDRLLWGVWRRIPGTRLSSWPVVTTARLSDRCIARWICPATIFHGLNGNAVRSLEIARKLGSIALLESPMMHPDRWQSEILQECRSFQVHPRDCGTYLPGALIRRFKREYQLADGIIVPSHTARQSFEDAGIRDCRVVLPGIDHCVFHPDSDAAQDQCFRVCYTGRVELGKGVQYLLEAWKRLRLPNAELRVIGSVRPEFQHVVRNYADLNIQFTGWLPREKVAETIRRSSLFVFPSIHEGFAMSILEAMASGLPVIATTTSGAADCVTEGVNGLLVPARSVDQLAEKIDWAYRNRMQIANMGRNARSTIENAFTLQHFEARMIDLYRSLAA